MDLRWPLRSQGITFAIDILSSLVLSIPRSSYESDPIFDVLLHTAARRDLRLSPYVISTGYPLAMAFLAAEASDTAPTAALEG